MVEWDWVVTVGGRITVIFVHVRVCIIFWCYQNACVDALPLSLLYCSRVKVFWGGMSAFSTLHAVFGCSWHGNGCVWRVEMTIPSSLQSHRLASSFKLSLEDFRKARESCFLLDGLPLSLTAVMGFAAALTFTLLDSKFENDLSLEQKAHLVVQVLWIATCENAHLFLLILFWTRTVMLGSCFCIVLKHHKPIPSQIWQ